MKEFISITRFSTDERVAFKKSDINKIVEQDDGELSVVIEFKDGTKCCVKEDFDTVLKRMEE